mmetsp:Transcript_35677/g.65433  ORF Transcript_35677/g.65433 Transcript_35677/m.65433 type:complete len:177 (+) Transcript_35677:81-611(+)
MGARCCCEESQEQVATLVDVSQMPIEEDAQENLKDETLMVQSSVDDTKITPEPVAGGAPLPVEEKIATVEAPIKKVDTIDEDSNTFTIDVEVAGRRLGFGIGHKHGQASIEVVKLHDDGVIPEWNKTHGPDKQVVIGSKIVGLNGVRIVPKDREEMLQDITKAVSVPRLTMEIERP